MCYFGLSAFSSSCDYYYKSLKMYYKYGQNEHTERCKHCYGAVNGMLPQKTDDREKNIVSFVVNTWWIFLREELCLNQNVATFVYNVRLMLHKILWQICFTNVRKVGLFAVNMSSRYLWLLLNKLPNLNWRRTNTDSTMAKEKCILRWRLQVLLDCCYIWMECSQWGNWSHLYCHNVNLFDHATFMCLWYQGL